MGSQEAERWQLAPNLMLVTIALCSVQTTRQEPCTKHIYKYIYRERERSMYIERL
jgi:hypothetical protein